MFGDVRLRGEGGERGWGKMSKFIVPINPHVRVFHIQNFQENDFT